MNSSIFNAISMQKEKEYSNIQSVKGWLSNKSSKLFILFVANEVNNDKVSSRVENSANTFSDEIFLNIQKLIDNSRPIFITMNRWKRPN